MKTVKRFYKILYACILLLTQFNAIGQTDDEWKKNLSFVGVKATYLDWETFYEHADLVIEPSIFTQVDFSAHL